MKIPITRTKVIQPQRRRELLSRPRLIELMLDLLDFRLVLLLAPAGYGKTSLLVDLIDQIEIPFCWYALDPFDSQFGRFISHFIASVEERFPEVGQRVAARVGEITDEMDVERVVAVLVDETLDHIRGHFIMVLDDYHLVEESDAVNGFVSLLVQQAGTNFHLILSSRTPPPLPDLIRMVAQAQVGGLSFDELAFQPEEIQALLLQNHQLTISDAVAHELAWESEGWITALLLSTQAMGQRMASQLHVARGSGVDLYDYLAQQVLDQQSPEVRDFLLRTSLLEEFNAEMCEAVLGESGDWHNLITQVLHNNLFVSTVDAGGSWIRYHHLFRDFLQTRLTSEHPCEAEQIRQRLAAWYEKREEWEKSYALYRHLGDVRALVELIERAGSALFKGGRAKTLAGWIEALPRDCWTGNPSLLSLRGGALVILGQMVQGIALLQRAISLSRAQEASDQLARSLLRRTVAHRFVGDYGAALADAQEALEVAEREGLEVARAEALRAKGMSLYHLGQTEEAITCLMEALATYDLLGEMQNVAHVHLDLGAAELNRGRYSKAMDHYTRALAYLEETDNAEKLANLLNDLAVSHHLRGDYLKAVDALERAFDYARTSGYTRMEAYILCTLGDIYQELDGLSAARDAYRMARQCAETCDESFLLFYLLLAEATLSQAQGNVVQARYLLDAAHGQVAEGGSSLEQALHQLASGRLALDEACYPEAIDFLSEAVGQFEQMQRYPESVRAHLYLAVSLRSCGDEARASQHLDHAFRLAVQLDSMHLLVSAGRTVADSLRAWSEESPAGTKVEALVDQVTQHEGTVQEERRLVRRRAVTIPFDPPTIQIQGLGDATARLGDKEVEWGWSKARDLLFCLLVQKQGIPKEALAELLWPESRQARQKARFKEAIYYLRRALGADIVVFDGIRYRFNYKLDYAYDVEEFLANLEAAAAAERVAERIHAFQAAIEHYRGPFVPPIQDEWALPERAILQQRYLDALLALATYYQEQNELDEVLLLCNVALQTDPALEEAHRLAMRVYAAQGNHAEVARQFERCRDALQGELAVRPSAQTVKLYKRLTG
ncbi:MAG: tetratricopeptide repeat protein [Chloroflexota bacterium]|nr:tetratricopeptide repeat protein [Chloroflexota bacterium]